MSVKFVREILCVEQGRKLYTHVQNLLSRKQDSQIFPVQKEANQGCGSGNWRQEMVAKINQH